MVSEQAAAVSVADVDGSDEAALIREVVQGSEQAFRRMYREHTPALFRLALRMTGGSESTAEDVLQDVWWRAVRGLNSFEARSSLRTWLSSIVVHCALERIRWEQRDGEALPEELPPSPDSHDITSKLDLERAFEAMPAGYRTVLVLHDIEGYRHEDIGGLLGIASGTSKSQLSRAREWMRRTLGHDYAVE